MKKYLKTTLIVSSLALLLCSCGGTSKASSQDDGLVTSESTDNSSGSSSSTTNGGSGSNTTIPTSGGSNNTASGDYEGDYYSSISDSLTGDDLLAALRTLNKSKRTSTVGYGSMGTSVSGMYKYTDYDPNYVQYDSNGRPYGTKILIFILGHQPPLGIESMFGQILMEAMSSKTIFICLVQLLLQKTAVEVIHFMLKE